MRLRQTAWILPALLLATAAAPAADDVDARIAGAAMTQGGAAAFLETLTDTVGGRVTGSPESRKGSQLILDALKRAGYENARFEGRRSRHGGRAAPPPGASSRRSRERSPWARTRGFPAPAAR